MNKIDELRQKMNAAGIDAILLADELNQRYLTGYPFTDGYCLVTAKSAYMLTDFRYREEAEAKVQDLLVVVPGGTYFDFIRDVIAEEKITSVGFEDDTLAYAQKIRLDRELRVPLVSAGDIMREMRMIKSEEELQNIREAQKITDLAFAHMIQCMQPEMTERDVALELEFTMRKLGAEDVSFETIAVSGSASSLPHGKCRNVKLQKGFLTMDFGCKFHGYCSDMTRTVVIGKADNEIRRVYDTVLQAQKAALDALCSGMTGACADAIARNIIDHAGYEGCFGHGLGHGVGLFIHEGPRLSKAATSQILVPGNVVTVEPGIYLAGKYGCRIEDMGAITENGFDDFTHSPKELIELF